MYLIFKYEFTEFKFTFLCNEENSISKIRQSYIYVDIY